MSKHFVMKDQDAKTSGYNRDGNASAAIRKDMRNDRKNGPRPDFFQEIEEPAPAPADDLPEPEPTAEEVAAQRAHQAAEKAAAEAGHPTDVDPTHFPEGAAA